MGIGFSSLRYGFGVLAAAETLAACCCCPRAPVAAVDAPAPVVAPANATLTTNPVTGVVAIKTCAGPMVPAADGLIDDLEDNNNQVSQVAGRGGYWWAAKDDKGSTIDPIGELKMSEGGAHGSKYALRVSGKTATGEKAWGSIVGLRIAQGGLYDASRYAGVSFFAKVGEKSTSTVRLKIADFNTHPDGQVCKDACYNDFGKDFTFSHDWQEYKVSFAELKQQDGWGDPRPPSITPSKLVQIAWHLSTPGADFELWLDDVRFTDCQ
jgi:endoglucanase